MPPSLGSRVLHRLIGKTMAKSSCLKPYDLKAIYIWYLASPSGPLPSLFKLSLWGRKLPRPWGHMFDIDLFREKHGKIFLSETKMP